MHLNVLITGAASGLGRGIAMGLTRIGHVVHLTDRDAAGLAQTQRIICEQTGESASASTRTTIHAVDMRSEAELERLADALKDQQIGVVINNAGIQHVARVEELPLEQWDTLLDVMLRAPFILTKLLLPGMRARGFGRFINIGSIHSHVGSPFKSAYVAAKHGLLGLSKVVALETGDAEITMNTICPAFVRTPLVERQISALAQKHQIPEQRVIDEIMLEPMPKHRFIGIDEITGTIEFLISAAAKNITGQTITIDGGWTAR